MKTATVISLFVFSFAGGKVLAGDWSPFNDPKAPAPLAPVENCLSYDFVDLSYGIYDFGTPYFYDGDFYEVGFSKSISEHWYLTGSFADGNYLFDCGCDINEVSTRRYRMGVGARKQIASCVDLTFEGGAEHTDAEYSPFPEREYDSWGYYVGPGIRARWGRFEAFAKALYTGREGDRSQEYLGWRTADALSPDEDGWLFTPGMLFHFTDSLSLKIAAEFGELDNAYTFGARYEF